MNDEAREKFATQAVILGLAGAILLAIIVIVWNFLSHTDTTTNF